MVGSARSRWTSLGRFQESAWWGRIVLYSTPGADVAELRMGGDERLEAERSERAAVVGHDRHDRQDLTGVVVDAALVGERAPEERLVVDGRELDRVDGVVLVRGR
jgi:hypothetical protein